MFCVNLLLRPNWRTLLTYIHSRRDLLVNCLQKACFKVYCTSGTLICMLFPSCTDKICISKLCTKYSQLKDITKNLLKYYATCVDAQCLFDSVTFEFHLSEGRQSHNPKKTIHCPTFEWDVSKLLEGIAEKVWVRWVYFSGSTNIIQTVLTLSTFNATGRFIVPEGVCGGIWVPPQRDYRMCRTAGDNTM